VRDGCTVIMKSSETVPSARPSSLSMDLSPILEFTFEETRDRRVNYSVQYEEPTVVRNTARSPAKGGPGRPG